MGQVDSGQRELNTLLFQNLFVIFKTNMSTFEDEFEIPAASEIDPAAEFLAKEQEELGDIGEDLGLGAPVQDIATFDDANDNIAVKNDEDEEGKDIYAGMQTLSIKKKDEAETTAMDELKQQAKQELEDWYKRYET